VIWVKLQQFHIYDRIPDEFWNANKNKYNENKKYENDGAKKRLEIVLYHKKHSKKIWDTPSTIVELFNDVVFASEIIENIIDQNKT